MKMTEHFVKVSKDAYKVMEDNKVAFACAVTTVVGLVALRRYLAGGVCRSKVTLHGKTVLITGANTGIGKETARDLARRGARVLIACRDVAKAEKAAEEIRQTTSNKQVVVYVLDLASLKSVRECASEVIAKESKLDILINNAGVMWTPHWKTADGFELQFGTNHLGHFLFTNLLLDLLKKSAPARIVNVSSIAHTRGKIYFDDINLEKDYSPIQAYQQSKLANVLFTRELSKRLKGTNVTANSLHPGIVATELPRSVHKWMNPVLSAIMNFFHELLFKYFIKTSAEGAQTSIQCAVAPELEGVTGKYFSDCAVKEEAPQAKDDEAAVRLWKVSEDMVGLKQKS